MANSQAMDGRVIYDYQIGSLEGRSLTLIEALGLREKQEESTKDILKGILRTSLYIETEHVWGEQLNQAIAESRKRGEVGQGSSK